ncbi:MAG: response regulator [Hyphomonadaceae bacterium]|nr:MAG: two-component system cell cycle sensor histidine kinase and response regulator CckA [Caulobacteraceae bacterium]MBT9444707.1 response regulator [Hyphomonadaceae bacterium]
MTETSSHGPAAGGHDAAARAAAGHGRPGLDAPRLLFWVALAMGLASAGVVVAAGQSAGRAGALLLIAMAAAGMVFLVWLSRSHGQAAGLFPGRGAAEAAAMKSDSTEHALLEALEEPALLTDRAGAPLVSNAAYKALADATGALGESERPPLMDRVFGHDPVLNPAMFRLSRSASSRQSRREVLPPTRVGGRPAMVRYEASVSPAPNGRVLWRLREMTDADAATDAEARALFIEDSPVGFFAARPDGAIVYMNRALRASLGVEDGEVLRVRDVLKEDAGRVLRRDRKSDEAQRTPVTLKTRDGREVRATAVSIWPGGEADGATRTFIFFEAANAPAQGNAAATANAVDSFFANAPFGAALLDGTDPALSAVLDSNAALMDIAQGRATPGMAFKDLFDASDGPVALAQRLRQASREPVELQLATNPPRAAHVYLAPADDGRGLAYVINVTEQRELEQRLSQAEKMREIGMLAGGVAHDFNNLLMAMMQNCDYLLSRHPVGDPDYMDLCEINHHALRAKELSERLRAYARQQTFKREVVEVSGFVAHMHDLVRRLLGETIAFEVKHGRDLPFIKADKSQLERVLVNLATNARDAMFDGGKRGKLTITTSATTAEAARELGHNPIADGDYVLLEVSDTGQGIKPEDQARIFRPFFSTKEAGLGTGLGLATSYGIIKQSEGFIFFDSAVGKGTTFRIYLPVYQPTAEEIDDMARRERDSARRAPVDLSGRGRILLVEDEDKLRSSIARNLVKCGYEIDEAEDGEDGLAKLEANPGGYDLVISDVTMPFMTGPEMLKAATTEMIGGAKVLFLSGYAPESFGKVLENFEVSYMAKPVGVQQLAQRVKELIAA